MEGVRYRRFSTLLDNRFLKRFQLIYDALGIQRPIFSSDLWYAAYILKVALDLRRQGCDLVHVYNYPQFASVIKCLNPKLRVILNMHGELLTRVKFHNLNTRLRKIDLIVSCSEFLTKSICAMFPQIAARCKTAPMGLGPEAFSRSPRNFQPDNSHPRRLLYVGRISPEKGVHVLLDAFELILQRYPDASLTIVGPEWIAPRQILVDLCLEKASVSSLAPFYKGSYLSQLKRNLSPGAAKRVTFTGLVAHSDVPTHYGNADIYINPSLYESFGMSIIEAMAAGVPVVATRVGAVPELISHGHSGFLVDAASPLAIADGVTRLFTDANLRNSISCVGRDIVSKQFPWQTVCSRLMQMYRDVLATKAA